MNLKLRPVDDLQEALALQDLLDLGAQETTGSFHSAEPAPGTAAEFLERQFGQPETLLVLAEEAGPVSAGESRPAKTWGFCLTGPLEDPWTRERSPLILGLWVEPRLRHRGAARSLVNETSRLLELRGTRPIAARAGHNDDALISMGERWGFLRNWEFMLRD